MKITLEEDLVTNSGRQPGSSQFLSLLHSFFKAEPFGGCSSPCGVKPLPRASAAPAVSAPAQALLPFSPVTGAEATNSCTQSPISSTNGRRRHSHELEEPSVHLQPSSRHNLRFLTYFITTEQLWLGRAGPPPAAEEIL